MCNKDTNRFFKLIQLFFENRYSKNLEDKIHNWLINPENSEEKEKAMREQWDSLSNIEDSSSTIEFEKLKKKLGFPREKERKRIYYYLPRVAAIFLPIIILAGIYYMRSGSSPEVQGNEYNTALTVLSVPYGRHEQKRFACGSEIWVNSGSKINYNDSTWNSLRVIDLEGEAYLSVAKHKDIPFIVRTKYLNVKVLGTRFNISAYPDAEATIVTLNKGRISVRTIDDRDFILNPNEQLVYNHKTKEISIQNLDVHIANDVSDWTTRKLRFDNETLENIALTLERRFNIKVKIHSRIDLSRRYTVAINEADNLPEVIDVFNYLDNSLSYEFRNNILHISNKEETN